MEGKFSLIKPNNNWRLGLHEVLKVQYDMEEVWNQMTARDGMREVDISHIGDPEAGEETVRIVVISDTHSTQESIRVPPGMFMIYV